MVQIQNALLILQIISQLFKTIVALVTAVEESLPESGQGAQKLELVKGWLQSAIGAQEALALTFDQLWPALQTTISSIVAIKNATGVFKKGG